MKYKRIFVLVMDSVGIGSDDKSSLFNDEGANTLKHIGEYDGGLNIPTLNSLGLGDLEDIKNTNKVSHPHSYAMKAYETSLGKDTLTGHWEMMGIKTTKPFKTFTETGFPKELIDKLEKETGYRFIGNKAASGTDILVELGEESIRDGTLIIYTSSDSVLQICGHEETVGLHNLYTVCEKAREICMDPKYKVGRVIARPFIGDSAKTFKRTANRHDYALNPPSKTVLNILKENGYEVSCVGKINNIFNGYGVTKTVSTSSNTDGMNKVLSIAQNDDFKGLCYINLVDFDSEFGHRRDIKGYKEALETFDKELKTLLDNLKEDDLLMITADHGNDPSWHGTDHTREKVPLIIYSKSINDGHKLEERKTFGDIGATILDNFRLCKPEYLIGEVIKEVTK